MIALFESALITAILASTIRGTTPILLAALGEAYAERSGLLNLGIEGMMVTGAFSAFVVALKMNSLLSGFVCAAGVGLTLGFVFGILTITLGVNQIVVGLGLTIFASSMCSFLHRVIFGNQFPILFGAGGTSEIPLLSRLPVIGQALFNQHWLVYLTLAMVPIMYILMYKTRFGLRVRAVGEAPRAAARRSAPTSENLQRPTPSTTAQSNPSRGPSTASTASGLKSGSSTRTCISSSRPRPLLAATQ